MTVMAKEVKISDRQSSTMPPLNFLEQPEWCGEARYLNITSLTDETATFKSIKVLLCITK